ncbi:MAG: formyltetrahydrofolate deformylase [Verrucomicrobia bacterium]|nr:formyltetrahydrofolate deformylase [Verrucomicrobiota bacterium]
MKVFSIIALLHGVDRPGLVAKVSGWIFAHGGNILHADQHRDPEENVFFQRVEWSQPGEAMDVRGIATSFETMARHELGMDCRTTISPEQLRVGMLVSRIPHCLQDLTFRFRRGEMSGELICVLSNHPDLRQFCESMHLPFHHFEVKPDCKAEAEEAQISILKSQKIDLIILARYMQVLSARFVADAGVPIINIHHSFLPAFAGGRPYHQAFARGVKIIGATAHYVTAALDEGPIIAQDVVRISHRHTVEDLIRKGRDLEQTVFAQAVRWHLEHRVLVYKNKTVVFD